MTLEEQIIKLEQELRHAEKLSAIAFFAGFFVAAMIGCLIHFIK